MVFCNKCGAAVVGKFCSCCGTRVRSQLEEYKLVERAAEREFKKACTYEDGRCLGLDRLHLASACWLAAHCRYGYSALRIDRPVPAEAYKSLEAVRVHAELLFERLLDF